MWQRQIGPGQVDVIVGDDPALQLGQVEPAMGAFKVGIERDRKACFGVAIDPRWAAIGSGV
ncbi:hypothetical protein D3C81_2304960 [compost metagenome]